MKILLFADGTGNAITTRESNVWRIYQSLDPSAADQISLYIPGVGTSEFKPWAMFDGATGIGVPENVLKLYHFLSWNWSPGDEIYMFGFSRGAFTIRLLIDLIYKEGLQPGSLRSVPTTTEQMHRNALAAWKSYKKNDDSRLKNIWVWLRRLGRKSVQPPKGAHVAITFAGLFDTVEAYGVPIEELRAAINTFVTPISFGDDHQISPAVQFVRHALSLDDERTSFHPIRIDQSTQPRSVSRIEEVWFSGVHSDVGGGYPDDAVAYAPLVWMLEEVQRLAPANPGGQGPILKAEALDDFRNAASFFAPLHDSRSGAAVLYRYDPGTIEAPTIMTYGPTIVHHSVVERMIAPSCAYAPVVLPSNANILSPDRSLFAYAAAGWSAVRPPAAALPPINSTLLAKRQTKALADVKALPAPNRALLNDALDFVWRRRVNYFALVGLLVLLVSLPFTGAWLEDGAKELFGAVNSQSTDQIDNVSGPVGNVVKGFAEPVLSITPAYIQPFVRAILGHPLIGALLIGSIWWLKRRSDVLTGTIHDLARQAWVTGGAPSRAWLNSFARHMRISPVSAWIYRQSKEWALPLIYSVLLFGLALALVSRLWFNGLVGGGLVCWGTEKGKLAWIEPGGSASKPGYSKQQPDGFATNNPCWASGFVVERGAAYRLTLDINAKNGDEPWFDQLIMTDVKGFDSFGFLFTAAAVFRRWPFSAWFQPIARIGAKGAVEWPLIPTTHDLPLSSREGKCTALPRRYSETKEHKEYCSSQPNPKACFDLAARLALGDPLPREELGLATAAWETRVSRFRGVECRSTYPRRTVQSDFVAEETGELFLFVNDVTFFPWGKTPQGFYTNNTGTATVTLQRIP